MTQIYTCFRHISILMRLAIAHQRSIAMNLFAGTVDAPKSHVEYVPRVYQLLEELAVLSPELCRIKDDRIYILFPAAYSKMRHLYLEEQPDGEMVVEDLACVQGMVQMQCEARSWKFSLMSDPEAKERTAVIEKHSASARYSAEAMLTAFLRQIEEQNPDI